MLCRRPPAVPQRCVLPSIMQPLLGDDYLAGTTIPANLALEQCHISSSYQTKMSPSPSGVGYLEKKMIKKNLHLLHNSSTICLGSSLHMFFSLLLYVFCAWEIFSYKLSVLVS